MVRSLATLASFCLALSVAVDAAGSDCAGASTCAAAGDGHTHTGLEPEDKEEELVEAAIETDSADQALNMLQAHSAKALALSGRAAAAVEGLAGLQGASADEISTGEASALGANLSEGAGWQDNRCLSAPEGNACIPDGDDPKDDPRLWTHYAYCSGIQGNRYRLSTGVTDCASKRYPKSRCKMTGGGLSTAQCDDPFCRFQKGNGNYCYNAKLVSCMDDGEPNQIATYCLPFGQDPVGNPALWTHFIKCTAGNVIPVNASCEAVRGALSRCVSGRCDDPFCRTRPPGRYCRNGNVVHCQGDQEPELVETCGVRHERRTLDADDDDENSDVSCDVTKRYTCESNMHHASCQLQGESQSCNIRRRRSGRRRCPRCRRDDNLGGDRDGRRRR